MAIWRTGRSLGRTLYKDDVFVGIMDDSQTAREIVHAMNSLPPRPSLAQLLEADLPFTDVRDPATGHINNCALANGVPQDECQMCKNQCPDWQRFLPQSTSPKRRL